MSSQDFFVIENDDFYMHIDSKDIKTGKEWKALKKHPMISEVNNHIVDFEQILYEERMVWLPQSFIANLKWLQSLNKED